jgi:hypothetical protein
VNRFGALLAGALVCVAPSARAAMVTDIAENPDPTHQFSVNLDLRWQMFQETGTITRQFTDNSTGTSYTADELAYRRTTQVIDFFAHFGLFRGFELHVDVPYVISDTQAWNYATVNGKSVQPTSTIQNNNYNADGQEIGPMPLFSVPGTVYRGGFADPTFGFTAKLMDDRNPQTLPADWYPPRSHYATWVIGIDYTPPLVGVMNPSVTNPATPNTNSYLPIGTGAHSVNFWTAISKRLGIIEPFLRMHFNLQVAGAGAYDNCSISAAHNPQQLYMSSEQATECSSAAGADTFWVGKTGLEPPFIGGVFFGSDFHAYSSKDVSLDFSASFIGDYISKSRTYSELSDELHKLTYVNDYFNIGGQISMDLRFAGIVHWISYFALTSDTSHLLTTESVGVDRNGDGRVSLPQTFNPWTGSNEVNPDYSFLVDQPGRQFGITAVAVVAVSTRLSVDF